MKPVRSAFWGRSFVAELTRIAEHGERKLKLRRESMRRAEQKSQQRALEQDGGSINEADNEHGGTLDNEASNRSDSRDERRGTPGTQENDGIDDPAVDNVRAGA